MIKYIIQIGLLITLAINAYSQSDQCQKLIVGIKGELMAQTINLLNDKYGTKSGDAWLDDIDSKILHSLTSTSPEIDFFSLRNGNNIDPDYVFAYIITTISIDTDEIVPPDSLSYIDPMTGWPITEYTDPIYDSEPGFWVLSKLVANSECPIPNASWILAVELSKDLEIDPAIQNNLMGYYRMINVIDENEQRRPVPAREANMEIELEKDYLSPLDEDTRKMEVRVKVKDCHGRYVYYNSSSNQPVYFQKNTGRCEYKQSKKCLRDFDLNSNQATVEVNKEYQAIGEYHLKKGIDPTIETVTLETCGLSNRAHQVKTKNLVLRGLEVKVKPVRKEIYQDEQTDIILSLKEVDPNGEKEPVAGKTLKLKIDGLFNGEISPKSNYVTDYKGEVRLNYKSGDKDEKITVTASFQPEDYPDIAEGKGYVKVKPPEYDATITIKKWTRHETLTETKDNQQDQGCETSTEDRHTLDEYINAAIYIQLKLMNVTDMPIYNQRWEYYQPVHVNISDFSINHNETHYMYGNVSGSGCAVGGYETNVDILHRIANQKINEPPAAPWIIAFDNKTNKAVKLIPGGYSINYNLNIVEKIESRTWDKDGEKNNVQEDHKVSENHSFGIGPVEDPKPDQTYKPNLTGIYDYLREELGDSLVAAMPVTLPPPPSSEKVPEINPDVFVQFGDGIKYFGGFGHKQEDIPKENGYDRKESEYTWQMTRKKHQQY